MTILEWALTNGWLHSAPKPGDDWRGSTERQLKRFHEAQRAFYNTFPQGQPPEELRAFYAEALGLGVCVAGLLSVEEANVPA